MKICTQNGRIDVETANRRETTPDMPPSPRLTTPFESERETPPPAAPSRMNSHIDQEHLPPFPPAGTTNEEEPPYDDSDRNSPPPDSDFNEDHPPGSGQDPSPLDEGSDEDPPRYYSDDDDNPSESDSDDDDDPDITLENMKTDLQFIRMVEKATLESQFSAAELRALRNPQELHSSPSGDRDLRLSIKSYIATLDHLQSQKSYARSRENIMECFPESKMLSYDQVKRKVSQLSGVITWKHHMCVNSCLAFTGPFADLEECPRPRCREPRYDQQKLRESNGKNKVPRKVFTTFPLGPQLQSRWKSPEMAQKMFYRRDKTQEELNRDRNDDDYIFDDIFCGSDYLNAAETGVINDYDTVVMLSIDGAQLYRNKKSDCWIYIWIIVDLAPDKRYKVRSILPGGVIPGPSNPKHLDSFLFPGLAHVSALQREGLRIWDGYNRRAALSLIFLLLALADAVAMAELSGSVGHHGRKGCRLLCSFIGRNKIGGSHYYPALLLPHGADNPSSNHPDVDITSLAHRVDPARYREDLNNVVTSSTDAQYEQRRLEAGIKKASIFDGLPRILSLPTCFPGDIMHQPVINLTALMFDLWCNRNKCRKGDPDGVWPWAVLKGDVWRAHGKAVADAAVYLPRSFDRSPRNPAEKLSSGYKAWELLVYFYGLGPGLFYGVLPQPYYKHYCKLVVAIRIIYQREIPSHQVKLANKLLLEWVLEFELLYYQRKPERLHFVRQCVHSLVHLGPEIDRLGPPSLTAQWAMERMIGIFGSLLKQPSNPFANLTEQAKKVAEINAIVSMWPDLERSNKNPHGCIDMGNGFILLGPKDDKPYVLLSGEHNAVVAFYSQFPDAESVPPRSVYRWGRLQIPTEQTARSHWKEVVRSSKTARSDRNVKVRNLISYTFDFFTSIDVNSVGSLSRCHTHYGSKILLSRSCCRKSRDSRALLPLFPC